MNRRTRREHFSSAALSISDDSLRRSKLLLSCQVQTVRWPFDGINQACGASEDMLISISGGRKFRDWRRYPFMPSPTFAA
jgi:hypothetical protein